MSRTLKQQAEKEKKERRKSNNSRGGVQPTTCFDCQYGSSMNYEYWPTEALQSNRCYCLKQKCISRVTMAKICPWLKKRRG